MVSVMLYFCMFCVDMFVLCVACLTIHNNFGCGWYLLLNVMEVLSGGG